MLGQVVSLAVFSPPCSPACWAGWPSVPAFPLRARRGGPEGEEAHLVTRGAGHVAGGKGWGDPQAAHATTSKARVFLPELLQRCVCAAPHHGAVCSHFGTHGGLGLVIALGPL